MLLRGKGQVLAAIYLKAECTHNLKTSPHINKAHTHNHTIILITVKFQLETTIMPTNMKIDTQQYSTIRSKETKHTTAICKGMETSAHMTFIKKTMSEGTQPVPFYLQHRVYII